MGDEWYWRVRGRQQGPLSAAELQAHARAGRLLPDHEVRRGVQGSWLSARRVKGLFAVAPEDAAGASSPVSPAPPPGSPTTSPVEPPASRMVEPPASRMVEPPASRMVDPPEARIVDPPRPDAMPAAPRAPKRGEQFTLTDELSEAAPPARTPPAVHIEKSPQPTAAHGATSPLAAADKRERTGEIMRSAILSLVLGLAGLCFFLVPLVPILLGVGAGLIALRAMRVAAHGSQLAKLLTLSAMLVSVVAGCLGAYTTINTPNPVNRLREMVGMTARGPTASDEWYDAAEDAIAEGSVFVSVLEATIGTLKATGAAAEGPDDEYLLMDLLLDNRGKSAKVDYTSWSDAVAARGDLPTLEDNFGNKYFPIEFGRRLPGQVGMTSLYPGDRAKDVLVFQRPVEGFAYLRLSLPASALGGAGRIQFQMSSAFVQIRRPASDEDEPAPKPTEAAPRPDERNPLETVEITGEPKDDPAPPVEEDDSANDESQ